MLHSIRKADLVALFVEYCASNVVAHERLWRHFLANETKHTIKSLLHSHPCAGPVRSELGYHLLWVEEIKSGGAANLSLHWTELEKMALNRKQALWFSEWTQEAKKKFFIHINN